MADASAYAAAAAAAEHRRKKNALDKAKANYLCTQLRVRLQYAKLKVDYGWQRQTLNEVENLYFRHSQRRRLAAASSAASLFSNSSTAAITPTSSVQSVVPRGASQVGVGPVSHSNANPTPPNGSPEAPQHPPTKESSPASESENPSDQQDSQINQSSTREQAGSPTKFSNQPSAHATPAPSMAPHSSSPAPPYASHTYPPFDALPYSPRNPNANPYAHYPPHVVQGHVPPAYNGYNAYSPHHYLSKAYVSSSPFPINVPATGSASPSAAMFGAQNQALTYDSFWSTHASWNLQQAAASAAGSAMHAAANSAMGGMAAPSGMPAAAPVVSGEGSPSSS